MCPMRDGIRPRCAAYSISHGISIFAVETRERFLRMWIDGSRAIAQMFVRVFHRRCPVYRYTARNTHTRRAKVLSMNTRCAPPPNKSPIARRVSHVEKLVLTRPNHLSPSSSFGHADRDRTQAGPSGPRLPTLKVRRKLPLSLATMSCARRQCL